MKQHSLVSFPFVFDNEAVYERANGFADRTHRVLNTLETRFGIASGTKFFTALAIGQLIDTGQLTSRP